MMNIHAPVHQKENWTLTNMKYTVSFFLKREAFLDLDMDPITGLSLNPIGIQIRIYNTRNN